MGRVLIFLYGLIAYAIGLGGLVWFILFVGAWDFLPRHINSEEPGPLGIALAVNIGLIVLFAVQHTVTARPSFKAGLTKVIPESAERSTYVLLSGVLMGMFCAYWQPIDGSLWEVSNTIGRNVLIGAYIVGWIIAVIATFLINHFELFGLQQVYCKLRNKPVPDSHFTETFFYRVVRHPLQLGVLIGLWFTPTMTMTHFMLAATMSIYVFVGLYYEEKDLVASLGQDYKDYQSRVRMILPIPK